MTRQFLAGLVMIGVCSVALGGCGRKGPLEPPPSTLVENEKGQMVEKPPEDKPFILDRLIR